MYPTPNNWDPQEALEAMGFWGGLGILGASGVVAVLGLLGALGILASGVVGVKFLISRGVKNASAARPPNSSWPSMPMEMEESMNESS